MRKVIITLTVILGISTLGFSQINGFESVSNGIECFTESPFNNSDVEGWFAPHGTPQVTDKIGDPQVCNGFRTESHTGNRAAYMAFISNNKEGIAKNYSFEKNQTYDLELFVKGLNSSSKLVVKLASGLTNELPPIIGGNPTIPSPTKSQLLIQSTLGISSGWTKITIPDFVADDNYNHLWIHPLDGDILVDDVTFQSTCCIPHKLWQNTSHPRSTFVNDFIKAGENVDPSQTQGPVSVNPIEDPLIFQAGNFISLEPGFESPIGSNFIAQILPCTNVPMQVEIYELDEVTGYPYQWDYTCERKFIVEVCHGSGDYSYQWQDGQPLSNSTYSGIVSGAANYVSIEVTDNITNQIIIDTLDLTPFPFFGTIDFTLYNYFTPDGDGDNDNYVVEDLTRQGSTTFGYNAYKYDVRLFNRYGAQIRRVTDEDKVNGFAWNEVFIDLIDVCGTHPSGTYSTVGDFWNCNSHENFSQSLTIMCGSSEPPSLHENYGDSVETVVGIINIYPSPNSGSFIIQGDIENSVISVFDLNGKLVFSGSNNSQAVFQVNLESVSPGVYTVLVSKDCQIISERVSITD